MGIFLSPFEQVMMPLLTDQYFANFGFMVFQPLRVLESNSEVGVVFCWVVVVGFAWQVMMVSAEAMASVGRFNLVMIYLSVFMYSRRSVICCSVRLLNMSGMNDLFPTKLDFEISWFGVKVVVPPMMAVVIPFGFCLTRNPSTVDPSFLMILNSPYPPSTAWSGSIMAVRR